MSLYLVTIIGIQFADFYFLSRRNNLGGSTQRYISKRTSLVKCAMDASYGDARDESSGNP